MDQQMSTQLSTKLSECGSASEHESENGTKDRSRRQRKVSQRFLNIYKNSEMSYIDRQVKKLSTMDDKNEEIVQVANDVEEPDPNHHVDGSSTSSGDSAVLPVDPCSTSCMSGNAIGATVHRYLKSKPKEEVPSSHCHSKQCYRRYSGKVMSVFKGRRGRPPKPLWVRVPRVFLTLTQDMEVDSYSQTKLLESNSVVPESSLVGQKALYMCKPSPVTTSPSLKPVACVSSGDCHPENHKLRNRPPLKKRRVDMLDVDTPSTHHSYCFTNSVYSSFEDICVGFGDTAQLSAVSVYSSSVPLCAEKEHCSEKQDKCGAMETAITNANRIGEVRSSCVHSGLTETLLAGTASTAQRECKDVCLSSGAHAVSLQSVVPHAVSAVQDQHQDDIPTDSLSVSISKETLGTLWHSLNTKAPTVTVEDKNVPDTTMYHESRSMSSFVADGTLAKNSSSSLVVSVPVTPIHSPSNCHFAKEDQNSVCSVSLAEVSSTLQMASTILPRPLDNPKLLPVHQDCRTVTCSTTTDVICDKSCTTLIDDGYLSSSCTSMEAVLCTQPNVETTQEGTPDRARLVQFSSVCAAVDDDSSTLTDHCHNSIPASANRHARDATHLAKKGASTTPPNVLDGGNFNPCLVEVFPLLKKGKDTSSQPAEPNEPRHECIRRNFGEDNTNPQKFCQPWQPTADALPAHHQEAVGQLIHKMPYSSEAAFPVDPCSSTNTASVVEVCECLQIPGSCAPNGHHPIPSNLISCTAAIGDRSCVYKEDATQIGTGGSTLFVANEDLNFSTESKVEEGENITKVPIQADPSFNNDGHNIKVMRPQREQARRKRNEKAFLYDENLVDLILAEHEPLLPAVDKNSLKSVKEDKASAVTSKPHLRRRGIIKASKHEDTNETSSSETEQSKGKAGKIPIPKLKGSFVERKQKLSAGKRKWEVSKDGRKNDKKGSWACKGAKTACRYDTKGKDKAARESTSAVKLAPPKVVPSLKGRTCTMTSIMDAKGDNVRVRSKLDSEGKQPVLAAKENHNQSILEPPPPRSRNYWRTAQAWLPRKVPEARQDVIALRQKSQDMQCRAVSKLHLEENNGWKWLGDPISVSKYMLKGKQIIRSYFIGMRRGRKQTEDLLARDCVLVFSGDVNKFPYVGRIVSLWQDSGSDEMMFTTAWYHRPADVLGSKSDENYDERELFASSHRDDNPVASIMCKCFVIGYNEYCRFRAAYSCSQSMAKCSLADALVPNPSPHQPVNFHIPAANSKIDLSHVFYCKNSLLSARHHTNRMKTDQRMRLKYMQKGVKPH